MIFLASSLFVVVQVDQVCPVFLRHLSSRILIVLASLLLQSPKPEFGPFLVPILFRSLLLARWPSSCNGRRGFGRCCLLLTSLALFKQAAVVSFLFLLLLVFSLICAIFALLLHLLFFFIIDSSFLSRWLRLPNWMVLAAVADAAVSPMPIQLSDSFQQEPCVSGTPALD